jgi:hypothetical protein
VKISPRQRYALELLVAQESHGYRNGEGTLCSDESALLDGQAFIHFQTARALERRGLVAIVDDYEAPDLWLTDAGRKAVVA